MAVLAVFTGLAVVIAVAALARTRLIGRRLDHLVESYWELRYEHGQLSGRLAALEQPPGSTTMPGEQKAPAPTAFVPLSSLRK